MINVRKETIMDKNYSKLYSFCKFINEICRDVIRRIEEGEYRNAITYLEVLANQATNIQIEESCQDPDLSFTELRDND